MAVERGSHDAPRPLHAPESAELVGSWVGHGHRQDGSRGRGGEWVRRPLPTTSASRNVEGEAVSGLKRSDRAVYSRQDGFLWVFAATHALGAGHLSR